MPRHHDTDSKISTKASEKRNLRSADELDEDFEHGTSIPGDKKNSKTQKDIHMDDNDRYGYDSDRGMYGHYHTQAHDAAQPTRSDRERGLQNSGPDLLSDYGAGEGGGRFEGREEVHNFANEFYEDTDNERFREARRNHAFRHGYDESDMRDRDDFTPGQSRGVSPGFDEVSSSTGKSGKKMAAAKKKKQPAKKKSAAQTAKKSLKMAAKAKSKTSATSKGKMAKGKAKKATAPKKRKR